MNATGRAAIAVAMTAATLLSLAVPAWAMNPPNNTALGMPAGDNAATSYIPPLGGYYYIQASGPAGAWNCTPAAPPWASDPQCVGSAIVIPLGGPFAKIKGTQRGWVKVEAVGVDVAYYRIYEIVTVEDDVGGYEGYDPRYGRAGQPVPMEEGGATEMVPAESYNGYDDRYMYGGTTAWNGLMRMRIARWMPEMELKSAGQFLNSIVANIRDNQYVRIWVHGPSEPMPMPIYLHCHPLGSGEVEPGRTSPQTPDWQIKVVNLFSGMTPPPKGGSGGLWQYPSNVPIIAPPVPVQRFTWTDLGPKPTRHWIVRIPWKGRVDSYGISKTSNFYGDIEVEAQIPSPAGIAQALGYDPTGMEEGSMQLRFGTVVEMEKVIVRLKEPDELDKLKDTWYRTIEYTLAHQPAVTTPDKVTIAFGAKVTGGSAGRDQDPGEMRVVKNQTDDPSQYYREKYLAEEVMANAVNRELNIGGKNPYGQWLVSDWPEDAETPWYEGGAVNRPSSVEMKVRGYAGTVERSPGKADFDAETPERPADATRTIETHFLNVVADVNSDGVYDQDDDDEDAEEGDNGGKGLLVNSETDAAEPATVTPDPNVRKVIVRFSTPVTSMSGAQVHIVPDSLSGFHLWSDAAKQQPLSMTSGSAGLGFVKDAPSGGSDLEIWISVEPGSTGGMFRFFLMMPDSQAGGDGEVRYMAMDEIKITVTGAGIDVDSDNSGTINSTDDEMEEDAPGRVVVLPTSGSAQQYDLIIRQHAEWAEIENPQATIRKEGAGRIKVFDASGSSFMGANDTSGTLSSGTISGSGSVTFKIEGDGTGEVTLKLEVTADGNLIALDWLRCSVVKGDLKIHNGLDSTRGGGGQTVSESTEESTGAVTVANLNDTDGDGTVDRDDNNVAVGSGSAGINEQDLMKLHLSEPDDPASAIEAVRVRVLGGSAKVWVDGPSGASQSKSNGEAPSEQAVSGFSSGTPITWWAEGTAASSSLRDVILAYEGRPPNSTAWIELDRVAATNVWSTLTGVSLSGSTYPSHLDAAGLVGTNGSITSLYVAVDNSLFGHGYCQRSAGLNHRHGGRVLFEWRLQPDTASTLGVVCDVTRQLEARDREIADGSGTVATHSSFGDLNFPENDSPVVDNETPNDDGNSGDEDNAPNSGYIYSFDVPSEPVAATMAFRIRLNSFREWVRIRLSGSFANSNGNPEGSRASDWRTWHYVDYLRRGPVDSSYGYQVMAQDTGATSVSARVFSGTGDGTETVTLQSSAVTEGFTASYVSATSTWTLTGTSGANVSATPGTGGDWTLALSGKVTMVIQPGSVPFGNGASFVFSSFKTGRSSGKANLTGTGSTNVLDGP